MHDSNTSNPKGWVFVRLGDIVETEKGKKPKAVSTERTSRFKIPYVNIKAFEKNIIEEYTDGVGCVFCEDGDFVMVWDGARSGFVGRAIKGALGSTLAKLSFPGIVDGYAFYFLRSKFLEINTRGKGVGIPHVDPNLLWNYDFPLPPLPEQHRIVEKIEALFSELDKGVEQLKAAAQQLKVYRQSVLKAAFEGKLTEEWRNNRRHPERGSGATESKGDGVMYETAGELLSRIKQEREALAKATGKKLKPIAPLTEKELAELPSLPEGWAWVRLSDVSSGVEYGSAAKSKETGKVPVLRMGNIQNGTFDWTDLVYTNDEDEIKKYLLKPNDVLFNRTNSAELVGKTAIYKGERPAIFAGYLIRINRIETLINADYLTYFLNTHFARSYGNTVKTFGVNQSNINGTKLLGYPLPLTSSDEQHQIVQEIETRLSVCDKLEETIAASLQQSEALRQSILKRAFEGKLVPQCPDDEPASVLLERIKTERAMETQMLKKAPARRRRV